ncbi:MAG: glycoside hydrolase family 19 protein [Rhodothermales bacterium]
MITEQTLTGIMPNLKSERRVAFMPHLHAAMEEFEINTPLRQAAFLAQLAHESGEFRYMEEIWGPTAAQKRYEPPSSLARRLGNTEPGDGFRYKGRGPIQVTGRDNYRRYGGLLGLDLEAEPEQAATPEVGFRIAGLYWHKNGLNELADVEHFKTITKRINGGYNGLEDRRRYYERARTALGIRRTRGAGTRGSAPVPLPDDGDLGAPALPRGYDAIRDETPDADA